MIRDLTDFPNLNKFLERAVAKMIQGYTVRIRDLTDSIGVSYCYTVFEGFYMTYNMRNCKINMGISLTSLVSRVFHRTFWFSMGCKRSQHNYYAEVVSRRLVCF